MAKGRNKVEVGSERPEFSPMTYLVRAALGNRLGLSACEEVAVHLLNQVGVLANKRLEDLADFFRVVEREGINSFRILSEYRVNPEMTPVSEAEIELMLQLGMDHLRTVALRARMPVDTVMDLDHTIEVVLPLGMTDTFTVGEAWRVALKSPLEAYIGICRELPGEMAPGIEEVAKTISWCRRAVGLILYEQLSLKNGQ